MSDQELIYLNINLLLLKYPNIIKKYENGNSMELEIINNTNFFEIFDFWNSMISNNQTSNDIFYPLIKSVYKKIESCLANKKLKLVEIGKLISLLCAGSKRINGKNQINSNFKDLQQKIEQLIISFLKETNSPLIVGTAIKYLAIAVGESSNHEKKNNLFELVTSIIHSQNKNASIYLTTLSALCSCISEYPTLFTIILPFLIPTGNTEKTPRFSSSQNQSIILVKKYIIAMASKIEELKIFNRYLTQLNTLFKGKILVKVRRTDKGNLKENNQSGNEEINEEKVKERRKSKRKLVSIRQALEDLAEEKISEILVSSLLIISEKDIRNAIKNRFPEFEVEVKEKKVESKKIAVGEVVEIKTREKIINSSIQEVNEQNLTNYVLKEIFKGYVGKEKEFFFDLMVRILDYSLFIIENTPNDKKTFKEDEIIQMAIEWIEKVLPNEEIQTEFIILWMFKLMTANYIEKKDFIFSKTLKRLLKIIVDTQKIATKSSSLQLRALEKLLKFAPTDSIDLITTEIKGLLTNTTESYPNTVYEIMIDSMCTAIFTRPKQSEKYMKIILESSISQNSNLRSLTINLIISKIVKKEISFNIDDPNLSLYKQKINLIKEFSVENLEKILEFQRKNELEETLDNNSDSTKKIHNKSYSNIFSNHTDLYFSLLEFYPDLIQWVLSVLKLVSTEEKKFLLQQLKSTIKKIQEKDPDILFTSVLEPLSKEPECSDDLNILISIGCPLNKSLIPKYVNFSKEIALRITNPSKVLFPILPYLEGEDLTKFLPYFFDGCRISSIPTNEREMDHSHKLDHNYVKNLIQILVSPLTKSPLRASDLFIKIHDLVFETNFPFTEEEVNEILDVFYANKDQIFTYRCISTGLQSLIDRPLHHIPSIAIRSVLNAIILYPALNQFIISNILKKLIIKAAWKDFTIWEGWILCFKQLLPSTLPLLLQLPSSELSNILRKYPELHGMLSGFLDGLPPSIRHRFEANLPKKR